MSADKYDTNLRPQMDSREGFQLERNPAYDGPMGIFTDYDFCDDPTELEDENTKFWDDLKDDGYIHPDDFADDQPEWMQ